MLESKRLENFEELKDQWDYLLKRASTNVIFLTYEWQETWWRHFKRDRTLHLLTFYHNQKLVGISPLNECGENLCLNGGEDVSDYLDIISLKGFEEYIWEQNFLYLKDIGAKGLGLHVIPETAPSRQSLRNLCEKFDCEFSEIDKEVTPYIDLPATWEDYLSNLDRKSRHEIRRKIRKIQNEVEGFKTYFLKMPEEISKNLGSFFSLLRKSSKEKEKFMTPDMESFFSEVVLKLAEKECAYLHFAEVNKKKLAATVSFVYNNEFLLYNSGFDPEYKRLSPGFVLTAYSIKDAIDMSLAKYDFLRGGERYKYDLGAKNKNVYNILIKT